MTSFKPMLAASEAPELNKLKFPLIAQPKFDGIRCTVLPKLGAVTRTLKAIPNRYIRARLDEGFVHEHYDGEVVTYTNGKIDPLDVVQSKVLSVEGKPDFIYHAFDHVKTPQAPHAVRMSNVFKTQCCIPVQGKLITDVASLMRYEESLVRAEWEGAILRDQSAPYKFGRSTLKEGILLKLKRFYDEEAEVIGFVEKMTNTNEQTRDERGYAKRSSAQAGKVAADTLGALVCRLSSGVEFEVGTGFTDAQRDDIWARRDHYEGRKVTFKYQRLGPNGKPLLPVYKLFRSRLDLETII